MTTTTTALSPFEVARYFRDHAPAPARRGLRGYLLRMLLDLTRLRGAERGSCFPSVPYLAEKVGRSVRHVRRVLAELEALGEIKRVYRKRADGGWSSSIYELRGLLSWAAENVRRVSDTHSRKPKATKYSNPARGGRSGFVKAQAAPSRPTPASAPADGSGYAGKGSTALSGDPSAFPVKSRALSPEQVEEARTKCDPVRWSRLLIEAGIDGATGDDLAIGAARRWRADAIMSGVQLVA